MPKLSISQAWDETRAILARDGKLIGTVALALFVLPGIVLNVLLPSRSSSDMPQAAISVALVTVIVVVTLTGQLSVIRLALGPHITVGEAIAHGARRVITYIAAAFIWTFPILVVGLVLSRLAAPESAHPSVPAAVGLLAVTALGIFVFVRMIFLTPVASAEGGGPIVLLKRSWQLTSGNWWRLFGFLLIFVVGALALIWAVRSVFGLIARLSVGELSPLSVGAVLIVIASQLVSAAISVVLWVMVARLYAQRGGHAEAQAGVPTTGI
jgi:hypothetical protein